MGRRTVVFHYVIFDSELFVFIIFIHNTYLNYAIIKKSNPGCVVKFDLERVET